MSTNDTKKSSSSRSSTQAMSVRVTDEISERIEKAAEIYRRQTGANVTASGLARTFIECGLNEFESHGGLVVSQ